MGNGGDLAAVHKLADIAKPIKRALHAFHRALLVARRRRTHFVDLPEMGKALKRKGLNELWYPTAAGD